MTMQQRRLLERRIIGHGRNGPIYAIAGGDGRDDPDPTDSGELAPSVTMEDLRGKTPEQLYELVGVIDEHLRALHQDERGAIRELTDAEEQAFKDLVAVRKEANDRLEQHRSIGEVFKRRPKAVERALANLGIRDDDPYADVRRLGTAEARDRALRRLDNRVDTSHLTNEQKTQVERQIRRDTDIARRILVTENDDYREAWLKLVTRTHPILTPEEQRAVAAWDEYRAMSEGVTTAGGFGIPVFIDPSIILTAQESGNPFLQLARQVTVNTNAWKGVSSAGVTWSFDAEAAAVSDDSPAIAQPSVTVFMARGFIPYSIEVGQDYPSFAEEMAALLAAGYDELLVDKFTRGTGSGEPQGILTALSANTNVRVTLTTGGTLGAPDPYKVWAALPQKYRRRANWLMSVNVNNAIRQLGTANVYHGFTVGLPEGWAETLFNSGTYESPYMPDTTTTSTATTGLAVVGDFANYVLARRGGMSVELVPTLFDVTNNRPTGQRGWFAYARIGGGSVNDLGFRLLVNA
jgi:HK97 family phage major capsid protein